ncbi:MAG: hypothetical protein U1E70_28555 [Acetobacteraceae bacterium]|nr:hypothetical protein [Pseudomonadota bacterium]
MNPPVGMMIGLGLLLLSNFAFADNRCSCPSVAAIGVGDSSCSAHESDKRCTVDFNLFGAERERRAISLLAPIIQPLSVPDPSLSSVDALVRGRPDQVPDFILIYLTVALADSVALDRVSLGTATEFLRNLTQFRTDLGGIVVDMFQRGDLLPSNPSPGDVRAVERRVGNAQAILSPGCIEVASRDVWVMFKTPWSQARSAPRCGPAR